MNENNNTSLLRLFLYMSGLLSSSPETHLTVSPLYDSLPSFLASDTHTHTTLPSSSIELIANNPYIYKLFTWNVCVHLYYIYTIPQLI